MTTIKQHASAMQVMIDAMQHSRQSIEAATHNVRFVTAVLRDSMLTPEESKARWDAIAECEERDGQEA